jgi:hypothetical protein
MKSTSGGLLIRMLSEARKVIPLYARDGEAWHTDIKLPDVVVENRTDEPADLSALSIRAFGGEGERAAFFCGAEAIRRNVAETTELLDRLIGKKEGPWRTYNMNVLFACELPRDETFHATSTLPPGATTCLRLFDLIPFHIVGTEKIDRVVCGVRATSDGGGEEGAFEVPLRLYECKGDYVFPMTGPVTIQGTAWSREFGHREATSQEFAFDVIDVRRLADGTFALSDPARSSDVADYFAFDREVLAIGDGVVAEAGNRWPDAFARNPLEYSVERVTDLTVELLDGGMPFNHAILGNYVVIDHRNGEFSLCAHMREGSVTVEAGEEVQRGQVIGRVGNTSNSEGPHLHFHLMDGPDFRFANGLPARFGNLPETLVPGESLPMGNPLLFSDYIFTHVE